MFSNPHGIEDLYHKQKFEFYYIFHMLEQQYAAWVLLRFPLQLIRKYQFSRNLSDLHIYLLFEIYEKVSVYCTISQRWKHFQFKTTKSRIWSFGNNQLCCFLFQTSNCLTEAVAFPRFNVEIMPLYSYKLHEEASYLYFER